MNLLKETIQVLHKNGKHPLLVHWVGTSEGYLSWNSFAQVAANVEYDNGFGDAEILHDIVVVGDNWWLERWEYDGSEGWAFKTIPHKPDTLLENVPKLKE